MDVEAQLALVALLIVLCWASITINLILLRKEQRTQKFDLQQIKHRLTTIKKKIS